MPEITTAGATPAEAGATPAQTPEAPETEPAATADDGLGEAGKRALEDERKARREAEKNAKQLGERLKALEESAKSERESKLTDAERQQARITDLEARLLDQQRQLQERTVLAATVDAAARLGFANPRLAYRLLDQASIEFDEAGAPTNVEPLLKDLLRTEPYLASAAARPTGSIDGGARSPRSTLTREAIEKMSPQEQMARSAEIMEWMASQT